MSDENGDDDDDDVFFLACEVFGERSFIFRLRIFFFFNGDQLAHDDSTL